MFVKISAARATGDLPLLFTHILQHVTVTCLATPLVLWAPGTIQLRLHVAVSVCYINNRGVCLC